MPSRFLKTFEIIGMTVSALVCLVLLALLVSYIKRLLAQRRSKIFEAGRQQGLVDMKSKLLADSWWLREDKSTMTLVQEILELDISQARDNWRKCRESKRTDQLRLGTD